MPTQTRLKATLATGCAFKQNVCCERGYEQAAERLLKPLFFNPRRIEAVNQREPADTRRDRYERGESDPKANDKQPMNDAAHDAKRTLSAMISYQRMLLFDAGAKR
jgi:hypothetical protein